jgi:hypothetical protein
LECGGFSTALDRVKKLVPATNFRAHENGVALRLILKLCVFASLLFKTKKRRRKNFRRRFW